MLIAFVRIQSVLHAQRQQHALLWMLAQCILLQLRNALRQCLELPLQSLVLRLSCRKLFGGCARFPAARLCLSRYLVELRSTLHAMRMP
jgi:hypothetical protein